MSHIFNSIEVSEPVKEQVENRFNEIDESHFAIVLGLAFLIPVVMLGAWLIVNIP